MTGSPQHPGFEARPAQPQDAPPAPVPRTRRLTIGEAAAACGLTAETLRHYDRIGLVRPHATDPQTGYRYYSEQEVVRLNTVQALRSMGLALKEIKRVLELDRLEDIVSFLCDAERQVDRKIDELYRAKATIARARADYERKLDRAQPTDRASVRRLERRVVMLSDDLADPTLDNLWNYLRHFYGQIPAEQHGLYAFEDLAGVYTHAGRSRLFATCTRYPGLDGLTVLPEGRYLCADCPEADLDATRARLVRLATERHQVKPTFTVALVVVTGVLHWDYQVQVPLDEGQGDESGQ